MKFKLEINRSTLYFNKGWEAKFHKIVEQWVLEDVRNTAQWGNWDNLIDQRKHIFGHLEYSDYKILAYRVLANREIIKRPYYWFTPSCSIELQFESSHVTIIFNGRRDALWEHNGLNSDKFVKMLSDLILEIVRYDLRSASHDDPWIFRITDYETSMKKMSWLDISCINALDNLELLNPLQTNS